MIEEKIYLIDDRADKRARLPEILDALNKIHAFQGILFVDGFLYLNSNCHEAITDAEVLFQAVADREGIVLLDLEMKDETQLEVYESIYLKLDSAGKFGKTVLNIFQDIIKGLSNSTDDAFVLSAILLAICKSLKTPCMIVSTASNIPYTVGRFVSENTWLPWAEFPSHPEDPIDRMVESISRIVAQKLYITPENFVEQSLTLSHKECEGEKALELLRRFFHLDSLSFSEDFLSHLPGKQMLYEALKGISGINLGNQTLLEGRRLQVHGIWLMAFGIFRHLFPSYPWQEIWDIDQLREVVNSDGKSLSIFGRQTDVTIRKYTYTCMINALTLLFTHRNDSSQMILKEVVTAPDRLSFFLDIDYQNFTSTFLNTIRYHRGEEGFEGEHDTSRAVFNFWLSTSFSDSPSGLSKELMVYSPVNILPWQNNKTELRLSAVP